MAKFVVDEEIALTTIEKWGFGELAKALIKDIFSKSQEVKCCNTCGDGCGPFKTLGIRGKCYCRRTRLYEKPTHYCAEWKEKEICQ